MKHTFKRLAATTALLCGVGLVSTSTPADAFWVNEEYLHNNSAPYIITKETSYIREDGANSKVFLNEVDPIMKYNTDQFPLRAGYEIAAPNGSDLRDWKLLIYEGSDATNKATHLVTYPFTALSNGGIFTDQQQGWGFGDIHSDDQKEIPFDADVRAHGGTWTQLHDISAHYVIMDGDDNVIQALAYHDEAVLVDGPAKGYLTTTIHGLSRHYRGNWLTVLLSSEAKVKASADTWRNNWGSWKLNNVYLEPDSTYGSLKRAAISGYPGINVQADELVQWWAPRKSRPVLSSTDQSPSRFGHINFAPENLSSWMGTNECMAGMREGFYRKYGPNFCLQKIADQGYFFDLDNDAHSAMRSIPNQLDLTIGSRVSIKITDDTWAKKHLTIIGLPIGEDYNPSMAAGLPTTQQTKGLPRGFSYNPATGILSGTVTGSFATRFVVASNNLQPYNNGFVSNGHNGHGITYRTFFMTTQNRAPIIETDPYPVLKGVIDSTRVVISDPDGDLIDNVSITGMHGAALPKGITVNTKNPYHPIIMVDKHTQSGVYKLWITATDKPVLGKPRTASKAYDLIVSENRPPQIGLPPLTFMQDTEHVAHVLVKDPDEGDKIVATTVTTPDNKPIPGVTFDVSDPANPTIHVGKGTKPGAYPFSITAEDSFWSTMAQHVTVNNPTMLKIKGYGITTASGVITITKIPTAGTAQTDGNTGNPLTVHPLTAEYRAKASSDIIMNGATAATLQLIPHKTEVPAGLNIVMRAGKLQLHTNGQTPIGIYEIAVRNINTKQVTPVTVHITPSKIVPNPVVQDHVIVQGKKATLPFFIHGVGQTRITMSVKGSEYMTNNRYQFNGAFTLDTKDLARPVVRVASDVKPGRYIIKLVASDVAQPNIRGEALMSVTVLDESHKPVITLDHQTAKKTGTSIAFDLKIADPNQGYIKAQLKNRTQLPRGIRVQPMSNGKGTNALVISNIVSEGTYPVTVDVRNSFGATGSKSFIVKVTKTTVEVTAQ